MVNAIIQRTRELLMKKAEHPIPEPRADETAPGVRMLKQVWDIQTPKRLPETAPQNVAHDIYQLPARRKDVPSRNAGSRSL